MHDFHVRWCACGEVLPILGRRLHHPFKRRGARLSGRFSTLTHEVTINGEKISIEPAQWYTAEPALYCVVKA